MKNPKKLIFTVFHIITPLFYFAGYSAIQFFQGSPVMETIPDTLSIIAIYSIVMNIIWVFNVDKLDRAIERDKENGEHNANV